MAGSTTGVDVFGPSGGVTSIIAGTGISINQSTGDVTITSTGGGGTSALFFAGQFGDASDGDLIVVGTYTAAREMHFNNLTIPTGTVFKPNGHRIFVYDTLTIAAGGSLNDNGNNGTGSTAGATIASRNYLGAYGAGGGAGWSVTVNNLANGNAGLTASGFSGDCSRNAAGLLPSGGRGGNVSTRTGGAAGAIAATTPNQKWIGRWSDGIPSGQTTKYFNGGSGGGGGAISLTGYVSGTFVSGGGGSGGGAVWISAKTIVNNGTISANGGDGGATSLGVSTGVAECAGGGGGGGGNITIITKTSTSLGTITAFGGVGSNASNFGVGAAAENGVNGIAGSIALVILS